MSRPRKRKPRQPNSASSPLLITVDLKQFLSMLIAALVGWIFGGALPFRVHQHAQPPITIIPTNTPVNVDTKPDKDRLKFDDGRETRIYRQSLTVTSGLSSVTLSGGE